MAADWQSLVNTTIKNYFREVIIHDVEHHAKLMHFFAGRRTPEEIAAWEKDAMKRHKAEQKRRADIEAAKSPAQKLKEKQDACDHEFIVPLRPKPKCTKCKLVVSRDFASGYMSGHDKGHRLGVENCQYDSDCY
jgi:hypothetical protein